ncbi:ABC-type transport system substrate-binding protein [Halopolyspora algeriensis]|uniref:ABC-type transport system substrate-binding protein n=1 Tax=Halopolyspora algeriensis TaxID=1500506 RepID=A0A368VML4_9ACTN|nr:ABC transporter family substrate-binding protein [Halopolyspora algeriensis]RCW42768.1 ABC-type transport system substrate-binding protein [Halopolyspora algeriensis]TQM56762.1 ABC-type transport system substrate-binding protein [Halopolyspora algeriensis]
MYQRRCHPFAAVFLLLLTLSVAAGCTSAPPPPLVETTAPPPSTSVPPKPPKPRVVVAAVGDLRDGFNPHALSDVSPATAALSNLMLPSVFEPGPNGKPRLNTTLMESAEVVDEAEKFTVRYRIRTEADWSDGAPIAAEDFVYLWQQMRSRPGVVNPAGYRLITDVASRQGGKTVEVTFSEPYPGWKTLFDDLLPAHLVKDAPGGWADALDKGYPASGGPFAIRQVDLDRGEIILMRNEGYFGPPAASERIVLRTGNQQKQVSALRSGDSDVALLDADTATMEALRGLGDSVRIETVPRPATTQLLLRPNTEQLADPRVRKAILAALDRQALIEAGTGGGPAGRMQARAQVLAPSEPGYTPTEPPRAVAKKPRPGRVDKLLSEAGFRRSGDTWMRDGRPLDLVIAAQFRDEEYVRIAEAAAEQLREQGIRARVITPTGDELFTTMLSSNPRAGKPGAAADVDMAVVPRPAGGEPASMMASRWGCPRVDASSEQALPYNMAGFCDRLLQPTIEAALTGRMTFERASARVEPVLWSQAVALPLYQQAQVLAVRSEIKGVGPGHGFAGPFSSAGKWVGTPGETYDW